MCARREKLLAREAARLEATPVACDIRRRADLETSTDRGQEARRSGHPCAQRRRTPPGTAQTVSDEPLLEAVNLPLRPVIALIPAAHPHLRLSEQGRIISTSSVSVREPIPNLTLSNAITPGVWGYLKTLSNELETRSPSTPSRQAASPQRARTNRTACSRPNRRSTRSRGPPRRHASTSPSPGTAAPPPAETPAHTPSL